MRYALGLALLCAVALPASAQTPAGSIVVNTARAGAAIDTMTASNPASLRIEELLDIGLTTGATSTATSADATAATPFTLTNRGNGNEAFVLGAAITGPDVTVVGFAIDSNGNGVFDASDVAIPNQGNTPVLPAGTALSLFVIVAGASDDIADRLTITARALTGSGKAGTTVPGGGDQGCDAIVGLTTAIATLSLPLTPVMLEPVPETTLTKSQSLAVPGGGITAVSGAIITYTLDANFSGAGVARAARLEDPLPVGTNYVPGSLRLDGELLTDDADADAGTFDGAAIRVALGDIAAPAMRSLSFQVIIK